MRVMGHNVLAIVVAAIAIYLIEFVIFGLLIPGDQYEAMVGLSAEQMHSERMPIGALPPLLAAIGLSLAIKWRNAPGWMGGVTTALLMALFFAFATSLYPYVYGAQTEVFLAVDLGHYLVCYAVAGAILGAWK
jgi:cytochrome bd-type quinol oxidase subunit 2